MKKNMKHLYYMPGRDEIVRHNDRARHALLRAIAWCPNRLW